ncbi:hypothetical protein B0H13DRAFT_2272311 [Mycena leptocephala]|nr:hypothetical protein B0H13DRAFT_2272311 [Mycena leptocephala]
MGILQDGADEGGLKKRAYAPEASFGDGAPVGGTGTKERKRRIRRASVVRSTSKDQGDKTGTAWARRDKGVGQGLGARERRVIRDYIMIGGVQSVFSSPALHARKYNPKDDTHSGPKKYEFYITWKAGIRAFCPYLCFEVFRIKLPEFTLEAFTTRSIMANHPGLLHNFSLPRSISSSPPDFPEPYFTRKAVVAQLLCAWRRAVRRLDTSCKIIWSTEPRETSRVMVWLGTGLKNLTSVLQGGQNFMTLRHGTGSELFRAV